ncbi:Microcystin degradation protein MlrC, contains DUF1485 domain [Virgibacillus subterraneus]|uniref:Microcystin degradation protein MlrC, contains DUF1485 domain n=1 Tax=Virgibacillus subterraneus TaxID=621109 RepID=A0A1H9G672_9BACI|nr:M81 family metallopeptidase [Virgibacillus subterraneus]SEQ45646.1 Microcystin degradation protein MlrC, contains DUF1485 domain [Virgibacillus subterraneus]
MNHNIRIGVAGIFHETNSFAPGRTELDDFRGAWVEDARVFDQKFRETRTSMGGAIDGAEQERAELVPGLITETTPSAMVTREAIEVLIDTLVGSIPQDLDGLLLILHGAMVSESYSDVEAEILKRLRKKLGNILPVVVTLDLHANTSEAMVQQSTCIVGYDTYPHVDMYERAVEGMEILAATIRNEINPTAAWKAPGMLVTPQTMDTSALPMKVLMDRAHEIEHDPQVLNVTVAGGFPYSDIPDAGMSFIVTTNNDEAWAQKCANSLSQLAWDLKEKFVFQEVSIKEAVELTLKYNEGPVIWIEGSDNVGGGSPADATHVLEHIVQLEQPSMMVIRDAEVAKKAHELGVGHDIDCELGGKSDRLHGQPVPIQGRIKRLYDGRFVHEGPYMTGKEGNMGKTAVIESAYLTVVVTELRVPPFDVAHVHSVGIKPIDYKIIVVKSAVAWKTSFGAVARHEINVDTPGCCSANLNHFAYKHVNRPVYPLDCSE